jgi:formylglycine-generating enzyme required for sulfatase activity
MVSVGAFCIDSTEVTNADYAAFLAAKNGDTGGQPLACAGHNSFALKCTEANSDPSAPVTCVAWCDAYAYCAWAGKRLCGAVGGGPNSVPKDDLTTDQWYFACSAGGGQPVPYGSTFQPGRCNDAAFDAGRPVGVATLPGCVGGFAGLFDMSGNVIEWEDSCTEAGGDYCALRGGHFADTAPEALECATNRVQDRETADQKDGFRCCSQ